MILDNSSTITLFINDSLIILLPSDFIFIILLSVACGATMSQNNSYAIISSYSTRFFVFLVLFIANGGTNSLKKIYIL